MTEQYGQRNINEQGDVVEFAAAVGADTIALSPSVQTVLVDESAVAATVVLPAPSDAGQNAKIRVVAVTGAANGVTVAVTAPTTLGESATVVNPIAAAAAFESLEYTADVANNRWISTGQLL